MRRLLLTLLSLGIAATFAVSAQAQSTDRYVKMSGDWYNHGTSVKLPVYDTVACTAPGAPAVGSAECPKIVTPLIGTTFNKNSRGFRASDVTVRVGDVTGAGDGLTAGKPFTLQFNNFVDTAPGSVTPPRTVPVVLNAKVQQLNTRLSWLGPVQQRGTYIREGRFQGTGGITGNGEFLPFNPNTRMFAANAWQSTAAGGLGGQTGRVMASTTPMTIGSTTPAGENIPLSFKYSQRAGGSAFGGTMSVLIRGNGTLYYPGALFGSGFFLTSAEQPGIVSQMLNAGGLGAEGGNNAEPAGGGWWVTNLGGQPAAYLYKNYQPPLTPTNMTQVNQCNPGLPISPPGCDLIVGYGAVYSVPTTGGGSEPRAFASATSVRNGFAWTTGRVTLIRTGTDNGAPQSTTFFAEGEDNVTTTTGGAQVRNIGMVAGRYAKRTSGTGVRFTNNLHGIQMRFTVPEPGTTLALVAGVGALGLLVRRRMS